MSKTLTITINNIPEGDLKKMWAAAVEAAPTKIKVTPEEHITIDYERMIKLVPTSVVEMTAGAVAIRVVDIFEKLNSN